jgi:hypothetical protein
MSSKSILVSAAVSSIVLPLPEQEIKKKKSKEQNNKKREVLNRCMEAGNLFTNEKLTWG